MKPKKTSQSCRKLMHQDEVSRECVQTGDYEREFSAAPRLEQTAAGLCLVCGDLSLTPDFQQLKRRVSPSRVQKELIVRAVRIRGKANSLVSVLDATAGLGVDSFLLASAGFMVDCYEQNPLIMKLLFDCHMRAHQDENLCEAAQRMHVHHADSVAHLRELSNRVESARKLEEVQQGRKENACQNLQPNRTSNKRHGDDGCEEWSPEKNLRTLRQDDMRIPDVIYLDPMFPERKKSAQVKKKAQLLQALEAPCTNEKELLLAALSVSKSKVVVKRPLKGECLGGLPPSYSLKGRSVRFDCYTCCND